MKTGETLDLAFISVLVITLIVVHRDFSQIDYARVVNLTESF